MGSPYLSSNETILLSIHNVVINTIAAEAILTSHRLMLLDFSHPQILPQDIPFSAIETVTIGENSEKVPVLSLSVVSGDGVRHTLGITFTPVQRTKRTAERDEWAKKLKELSLAAQKEHEKKTAELLPPWVPGELPGTGMKSDEKSSSEENVYRPLRPASERRARPSSANPKKTRTIILSIGIAVVIVAVVLGSFFLAPSLWNKNGTASGTAPTAAPTPAPTTVPAPEITQTPLPTAIPTPETTTPEPVTTAAAAGPTAAPKLLVPDKGVWIHVTYDGLFSGTVGTSGGIRDVSGSGEGMYQIPVASGILLASVEKLDNSGRPLTVEFYKDGVLLKSSTTRVPMGLVDAQTEIPAAKTVVVVTAPSAGS